MKHQTLIILLLLFFGSNCIGQKMDTTVSKFTIATNGHRGEMVITTIPKQDTVRVLMLVCDTSLQSYKNIINGNTMSMYDDKVWWQFGYEVYETEYGQIPCNANVGTSAIATVCYGWYRSKFISHLDQNKKRLNQSIVVWITKEIK